MRQSREKLEDLKFEAERRLKHQGAAHIALKRHIFPKNPTGGMLKI
jgi:hypothetical protein